MVRKLGNADGPWFVRSGSGLHCNIRPVSSAGWLLTLLYVAVAVGISVFFMGGDEPEPIQIAAWALLMLAATFGYLLIAWRTSAAIVR